LVKKALVGRWSGFK